MNEGIAYAVAFSKGCDARLAGKPLHANPYRRIVHESAWLGWRRGWLHCSRSWAEQVRGRWTFIDLPPMSRDGAKGAMGDRVSDRYHCSVCGCGLEPDEPGCNCPDCKAVMALHQDDARGEQVAGHAARIEALTQRVQADLLSQSA